MKLEGKCTRPKLIKFSWAENQVRWAPHTHKEKGRKYIVVSPNITIIKWTFYEGCSKSIGPLVGKNTIIYLDV